MQKGKTFEKIQKWTPGPWYVLKLGDEFNDVWQVTADGRKGYIEIASFDVDFSGKIADEQKANAHLIAAAPDLWEVVADVVSDCQSVINPGLYKLAVKALAKSKGEER